MESGLPESFERGVPHILCRVLAPSLSHIPPQGFRQPWMPWPSELRSRRFLPYPEPQPSVQVATTPRASIPTPLVSPPQKKKKARRSRKSKGEALPGPSTRSRMLGSSGVSPLANARQRLEPFVSPKASCPNPVASTSPQSPLAIRTTSQATTHNSAVIPQLPPDLQRKDFAKELSHTPTTQNGATSTSLSPLSDYRLLAGHNDLHSSPRLSSSPAPPKPEPHLLRRSLRTKHCTGASETAPPTKRDTSSPDRPLAPASTKRKNNDEDEDEPARLSKRVRISSVHEPESQDLAGRAQVAPRRKRNPAGDGALPVARMRARQGKNGDKPAPALKKSRRT